MKKVSVYRMIFLVGLYSIFANVAHPIEPTIYLNLGCHDYIFGVAMAAMSLTNFLFAPFWGKMLDRYGCAKITGFSFFGYALAQYFFATATTELGIALARLLAGVFISTISVSQLLYVMRYSPEGKTSTFLMYNATTAAVLSPVGYLIGGVMGDFSIWGTMMLQVVGLVVIGVLFFLILDDEKKAQNAAAWKMKDINPLKSFGEIRPYMSAMVALFFMIAFAANFASVCYEHSFNYLIEDEYGFSPSYNGLLKACVGVVAFVSNATLCSYLLKKTDVQKSFVGVLAILTVMSVCIVLIKPLVPFVAVNVLFFGFNAVYLPLLQDTLTKLSKGKDHGIFVGMFNAIRSVGSIGGSLVAGFAYALSTRLPFAVTAVLFALAAVCAGIYYRRFASRKAQV